MPINGYGNFPDGDTIVDLTSIEADVAKAQSDIEGLQSDVGDIQTELSSTTTLAKEAMHYKGTVANATGLTGLDDAEKGDLYLKSDDRTLHVYDGSNFVQITDKVDLSDYLTEDDLTELKSDVSGLKTKVSTLESDVATLKSVTTSGLRYKGSVANREALDALTDEAMTGDMYNAQDTDLNYVFTDSKTWDPMTKFIDDTLLAKQADLDTANGKISALETDNTKNKSDIAELQEDNTSNKSKIGTLETDNTSNKSRLDALETDNDQNKEDIEELQGKVDTLESTADEYTDKVDALETDNASNKSRLGTLETDNTSNKGRLDTIEETLETLESVNDDIEDIQGDIESIKGQTLVKHTGTYTIPSSGWQGESKPFTNTATATGLGANDLFFVQYTPSQKAEYMAAKIDFGTTQSEGAFSVVSNADTKPTSDLTGTILYFTQGIE